MDVTRKNFAKLLPELQEAVSKAEFLAIDLELTGLTSAGRELEATPFDTAKQYYEKLYKKALHFLPLQLGVCIFQHDAEKDRYTYQAYNFYIFPFSKLRGYPDSTFHCQCSSLAFLSSYDFDFNKTFREGIPFLTQQEEDKLRTIIKERHQKMGRDNSKETVDIPVPDDMKIFLQRNITKIKNFVDDSSDSRQDHFILDQCNGFMRRLLYQEVPKEFGDTVQLETCDDSIFAMKVFRGGGEELKKLREEEKKKNEWKDLEEAVGLSHFIKMISTSGKLIIGHNCLLDICHIVNRFRYPLPSNYNNFKELVHHIFARTIDTKFMSTAVQFKDLISSNVLSYLRKTLSEAPFEMPVIEGNVEGCSYSDSVDKSHEGAYDAYLSGQCFLAMCLYLAKSEGRKLHSLDSVKDLLSNFENRLYIMKVQDVPFIRFGAQDPKPPRNHVFHLQFPREWRQHNIVELFKPFGPVFIHFLDDRSAFVSLHKRDQAKAVLKTIKGSDTYTLTSFGAYQKQIESSGKSLPPTSPSLNVLRKRKSQEPKEASDSPDVFKKHCGLEQPSGYSKRSIDPIPEEAETGSQDSSTSDESTSTPPKNFAENEVWM